MSTATIARLEALAANAWPAAEIVTLDGWRLRFTGGVTRRANSVWPNAHGGAMSLCDKLRAVEQFYGERNAPVIYQICGAMQPPELDSVLADRGYVAHAHSLVQCADVTALLASLPPLGAYPDFAVEVLEQFDPVWFDLFCTSEELDDQKAVMRKGILERIAPPHGFTLLRIAREPAAVGLGVVEDGWMGVFCVATLPLFRRRGAARALTRRLAVWGQLNGAEHVYLQVMEKNAAAQALYAGMGFANAYGYHYRVKA